MIAGSTGQLPRLWAVVTRNGQLYITKVGAVNWRGQQKTRFHVYTTEHQAYLAVARLSKKYKFVLEVVEYLPGAVPPYS